MCGSAPSAPALPAYPDLTPQEQANLGQQSGISSQYGNIVQGASQQLGQNQNILQQISGLFNKDGSLNQSALAQLQQQSGASTQAAGVAGQSALNGLSGTQTSLNATNTAYQNALQNGAPANQQIAFQQNQNFQAMKQQAAQQGIQINGDNWANATSSSTAGLKLLQNAQQNNNIQNQNYNLGYLSQAAGNMGQLSSAQNQQASTGTSLGSYATQTPLNYLQSSITNGQSALSPLLQAYQSQLTGAYQPLYMQQIGPYQQQMAQAQANYQGALNQYNGSQAQIQGWAGAWGVLGGQAHQGLTSGSSSWGGAGSGGVTGSSGLASGATDLADVG